MELFMWALLSDVVKKRCSHLPLHDMASISRLNAAQVTELLHAIVEELTETGLMPDSEPNERGRKLDDLIDEVRRLSGRS